MAYVLDAILGKGRTDKVKAQTIGTLINAATAKTTPVDADNVPISDSAASHVLKKVTWANVKATLKTYFDTLYAGASNALLKANNLSDVQSAATSRTNLGLAGMSTVADAPSDSKTYGRKNGAWDAVDQAEVASAVHGATGKSSPAGGDEFGFADSADSFALKKITFTEVYLAVKASFDLVYQATGLALLKASNLSDLANTTTARSNLGLGTAATGTAQAVTVSSPLATSQAFSVIGAAAPTLSLTTQAVTVSAPLTTSQAMSVVAASAPTLAISAATTEAAGSMSSADKTKLDGIAAGANLYVHPNHSGEVTSTGDGATAIANKQTVTFTAPLSSTQSMSVVAAGGAPTVSISAATTEAAGSMSSADKTKLDGITVQSATISAPLATSQAFSVIGAAAPTLSIPAATSVQNGYMTSTYASKLDGIEASADVTDATNVASSINGVAAKSPPVDADKFNIIDTEASNALKTVTGTALKSYLKTYFDGLYAATGGGAWTTIGAAKYTAEPASTSSITIGCFE